MVNAPRMTRQSRLLLAALRAAAPEPLPPMTLALVLWPDGKLPSQPMNCIHVAVARLRAHLESAGEPVTVGEAFKGRRYALVFAKGNKA